MGLQIDPDPLHGVHRSGSCAGPGPGGKELPQPPCCSGQKFRPDENTFAALTQEVPELECGRLVADDGLLERRDATVQLVKELGSDVQCVPAGGLPDRAAL